MGGSISVAAQKGIASQCRGQDGRDPLGLAGCWRRTALLRCLCPNLGRCCCWGAASLVWQGAPPFDCAQGSRCA